MNLDALSAQLAPEEGTRLKPYRDSVGKLTIGVGRNLDDVGISQDEADYLLVNDIKRTVADMSRLIPWWTKLDEIRQRVLADMCFNMGTAEIAVEWPNFCRQLQAAQYDQAADNMLSSVWAKQVGPRAIRLAEMMRTGSAG
jgi:lysozyme